MQPRSSAATASALGSTNIPDGPVCMPACAVMMLLHCCTCYDDDITFLLYAMMML